MVPRFIESLGVTFIPSIADAVRDMDVIMMLRIQLERQAQSLFPTIREYSRFFGLSRAVLDNAPSDVLIMHPGPVNRGIEMSADVMDGPKSIILDQVTNGVAVRMALMYLLIGK